VRVAFRVCSRTQHVNRIKYSGNCTHHPLFDTKNFCGLPTQSFSVFCVIFATAVPSINQLVLPLVTHSVLCEVCIYNVAESRSSIAGLSPRMPGFSTVSGYMRFVVDKVAVEEAHVRALLFPLSVSFHQCSIIIFIVIPVLSEGQAGAKPGNFHFWEHFVQRSPLTFFGSVFRQSNERCHRTERRDSACAAFCSVHIVTTVQC
jgi:hypothetical protein